MPKLRIATSTNIAAIPRSRLRRGVLHNELMKGPKPSSAGRQSLNSGLHFSHRVDAEPMLLQFPPEILQRILAYLQPIWLFQVAAAYPQINTLLGYETSNRIWYDVLPAALFLEPENFQDEELVKDRIAAYSNKDEVGTSLQLSMNAFSDDGFYYDAFRSSRFVVPAIANMSELSTKLDFSFDVVHPTDRRFYPMTPTRVRVMALGGPFQPWLDYRQEIAGHLHYAVRCLICFEIAGQHRPYRCHWGMIWCCRCYNLYMLEPRRVAEVPGLDMLVKHHSHQSAIQLHEMPGNRLYRPLVDEVLRKHNGLDFEAASAIQMYICQLLETTKGSTQSESIKGHRRRLRMKIARRAQEIWASTVSDKGQLDGTIQGSKARQEMRNKLMIIHSRDRWAPTSKLPQFLFPARLLSDSYQWAPFDPTEKWLKDPTLALETSREVIRAGHRWVDEKAKEMVNQLVTLGAEGQVTDWIRTAERWHVRRITRDLHLGKYLNLEYGGSRFSELMDVPTVANNRLDVIAKKLRIDPLLSTGTLTAHEKKKAVACFNKIVLQRCGGCPHNNLLSFPCGLQQIVRHYRQWHADEFFLNDKWTIRG